LTSSPCSLCERLGFVFLPSAPAVGLAWSHLSCIFNSVATTPIGLRSWQAGWLPGGQHMDLSEARGLVLFRVVREGIGITRRLSAAVGTSCLQAIRILTLEPEPLKNRSTTPEKESLEMERGSHPRRSSGLRLQFLDVEVFSFLPQCQRNGSDLACQGEAHHGRLDAFGQ